ncbi:MAG: hypothetical protein Kow0098_18100 [Ignavibacteriaceae bacterium]
MKKSGFFFSLIFSTLLSLIINESVIAQDFEISGLIRDTTGNPIPGVNITIQDSDIGTASLNDGSFIIKGLTSGKYLLRFSAVGYADYRVTVNIVNKSEILNVTLSEQAIETPQVIVTAGKYEQNLKELTVSADIISSDLIRQKNFTNLEDALRYVPGINMTDDQISIRGSGGYSRGAGSRALLALDGLPFYTGDTGETIWEIIPVNSIKRVEIIKGAASSLYGSTAIGGVINVLTRSPVDGPETSVKSFIGVYDKPYYSEWDWSDKLRFFNGQTVSHTNHLNDFYFTIALTRLESEGYKQNGFYHKYNTFIKGLYKFSPASELTLLINTFNKKTGDFIYWKNSRNALVPPDEDQGQRIETNRYLFGAIYKNILNDDFFFTIRSSYYLNNWNDNSESLNSSNSGIFRNEIQSHLALNEKLILISGVEGTYSNVTSSLFGNRNGYSLGAYTQADLRFDFPLMISAGVRYDYNSLDSLSASDALSPKVGLNFKLTDQLILRSSFGTGFRAPTSAEAFTSTSSGGITVKPNPAIKPETNFTFEAGINYNPVPEVTLDAAVFHNEYYDFIEPGIDSGDGLVIFGNLTHARIQGAELNLELPLIFNIYLSAGYTYLYARDVNAGLSLKYRPKHTVYSSLSFQNEIISLGLDFRYWTKVERIDEELSAIIPDAELRSDVKVVDFRAAYNFSFIDLPLNVLLNVNNIFNYNYVELIGNVEPIRNYSLTLEIIF